MFVYILVSVQMNYINPAQLKKERKKKQNKACNLNGVFHSSPRRVKTKIISRNFFIFLFCGRKFAGSIEKLKFECNVFVRTRYFCMLLLATCPFKAPVAAGPPPRSLLWLPVPPRGYPCHSRPATAGQTTPAGPGPRCSCSRSAPSPIGEWYNT